jgi:predicted TIM-barrel fold metal-dependent hydrolase
MQMDDMILVSVDDHVCEPPDMFERHVPAKYQDRAPKLLTKVDGSNVWMFEGQQVPNVGLNAVAGRPPDEYGMEPTSLAQLRKGCWDVDARIDDMNANGVLGSMCFASMCGFTGELFNKTEDRALGHAMLQAYNDWHIDSWCGAHPGRFIPLALPTLRDPEATADEIRRVAKKGCHAITFPDNPAGLGHPTLHSEFWRPIWQACDEEGTIVCVHIGSGTGMNLQDVTAPVEIMITGTPISLFGFANEIVFSRWIHEYPNLKFALSEGGVGWIPYFLERADYVYEHHHAWTLNDLGGKRPSDIFREHIVTCFIDDAVGLQNRALIGTDTMTWECDYPHSDSTWPIAPEVLWKTIGDLPRADIDAITHRNAMEHFRYDPFQHVPKQEATVGALRKKATHVDVSPTVGAGGKQPSDYERGYCTIGDIMQQMAGAFATAFADDGSDGAGPG